MKSITAKFRRASRPFWEAVEPIKTSPDCELSREPQGRPLVVIINDDIKSDYRIKVWSTPDGDGTFDINGEVVSLPHRAGNRHEGRVDEAVVDSILSYHERANAPTAENMCLDIKFVPGKKEHHRWPGTVVSIEPTGWGEIADCDISSTDESVAQSIYITAPDAEPATVPLTRINGIWGFTMPIVESSGEFEGRFLVSMLPDEIAAVREGRHIGQSPEPTPPRSPRSIRTLRQSLLDTTNMSTSEYHDWQRQAREWASLTLRITYAFRELNYQHKRFKHADSEYKKRVWWLKDRFDKRAPDYRGYDLDDWLDKSGDRYGNQWRMGRDNYAADRRRHTAAATRFEQTLDSLTADYNATLAACQRYEFKYADIWM